MKVLYCTCNKMKGNQRMMTFLVFIMTLYLVYYWHKTNKNHLETPGKYGLHQDSNLHQVHLKINCLNQNAGLEPRCHLWTYTSSCTALVKSVLIKLQQCLFKALHGRRLETGPERTKPSWTQITWTISTIYNYPYVRCSSVQANLLLFNYAFNCCAN